jgi:hypothetical protein
MFLKKKEDNSSHIIQLNGARKARNPDLVSFAIILLLEYYIKPTFISFSISLTPLPIDPWGRIGKGDKG